MLVRSFHSDRNRYNEDNEDNEHAMHTVTSLEPVMFLEKNQTGSFSNSMRFSSGPSTLSTLQNRNTATTLKESPLPSPMGHTFSNDAYVMMEPIEGP